MAAPMRPRVALDVTRRVIGRVTKAPDIEVHVSLVSYDSSPEFVELAEYIVSLGAYGRGLTVPKALAGSIAEMLSTAGGATGGA